MALGLYRARLVLFGHRPLDLGRQQLLNTCRKLGLSGRATVLEFIKEPVRHLFRPLPRLARLSHQSASGRPTQRRQPSVPSRSWPSASLSLSSSSSRCPKTASNSALVAFMTSTLPRISFSLASVRNLISSIPL